MHEGEITIGAPSILHYPGSKWIIAEWIIEHMPPKFARANIPEGDERR